MNSDSDSEDYSESSEMINVNSNGIIYEIFTDLSPSQKSTLTQCQYCLKFYNPDLIIQYEESSVCYHCLFWINSNVNWIYLIDLFIQDCRTRRRNKYSKNQRKKENNHICSSHSHPCCNNCWFSL